MTEPRTFQKTHPWINFSLDLRKVDYKLWFQLGEVQAKCEQVASVQLLPTVADELRGVFLAKGALATTAIEGNTLSEEDALKLIKGELDLPQSKEFLGQEIKNIVNACNMIASKVLSGELTGLTLEGIKELNTRVLHDLPPKEDVHPGQIREYDVGVANYRAAPPQDCEFLIGKLCGWLNSDSFPQDDQRRVAFGILKAIAAHLYIAWIHPFGDGNGRTSRLVEFQILLSSGVPTVAAHLLSNHYNQTRTEYYRQLDQGQQHLVAISSHSSRYALQGFKDGLDEQIQTIQAQQFHVHWINYVHSHSFCDQRQPNRHSKTTACIRTCREATEPVPIVQLALHFPENCKSIRGQDRQHHSKRCQHVLEALGLISRSLRGRRNQTRDLLSVFLYSCHLIEG